jgi:hypothetical protein
MLARLYLNLSLRYAAVALRGFTAYGMLLRLLQARCETTTLLRHILRVSIASA